MLANGCDSDSLRRIGGAIASEIPFVGEWVGTLIEGGEEEKLLDIKTMSDGLLLQVKQYFDGKLEQVANHVVADADSVIMEFTRKNAGKVTGKLKTSGNKGVLELEYPDTTLTIELTKQEPVDDTLVSLKSCSLDDPKCK